MKISITDEEEDEAEFYVHGPGRLSQSHGAENRASTSGIA
jgi:hypothetical protein